MNKFSKILSGALALFTMLSCVAFSGCGKTGELTDVKNAPDYSQSTENLDMFAYVGPTDGRYTLENGKVIQENDFRTKERYQEYKDCGFETLLLLGNDGFNGAVNQERFEEMSLKKNLDLCKEVGLNCIVFDLRLHDLSIGKVRKDGQAHTLNSDSLIGAEQWQFATIEDLVGYIKDCMKFYYDHEAFYGVTIKDEPKIDQLKYVGDFYKAMEIINADRKKENLCELYINTVMLPYNMDNGKWYSEDKSLGAKKAYKEYVKSFLTLTGADAFDYDAYPFKYETTNDCALNPEESVIETFYFSNLQMASVESAKLGKDFYLTMQSHASSSGATNSAKKRKMRIEDFRWQLNAAFSFGAKDLRYYTYWTFPTHTTDPMDAAIMSDRGEKQYYDFVKTTNEEAQKQAKVVLNFDYQQTLTIIPEDRKEALSHFASIDEVESYQNVEVSSNCGILVNQMLDKKNSRTGYYVFNAEDPAEDVTADVSFVFKKFKYVAVYQKGERKLYKLKNGKIDFKFTPGEGALIIPFN